jgi:nucleoside-diphosphate-sugar epimerase
MASSGLHVVLGSTGGAGNAIARALYDAGIPTRAVNRAGRADLPAEVERASADITSPRDLRRVLDGADVVYMAAQPAYHRWSHEFPAMLQRVIDACAAAGCKLVMVDNLYGYGPTEGPISEESPKHATDTKGILRARMTAELLAAHKDGRLRVAVGQSSDYFGPRCNGSAISVLAFQPLAEDQGLRWLGSLDVPHAAAYLPDIARAYVILGTSEAADGREWILPHAPAATGRQFLKTINRTLPERRRIGAVSPMMLRVAAPLHRESRELLPLTYQWTKPFEVDDRAFQEAFGPFAVTPLPEAIAVTAAWYEQLTQRSDAAPAPR